MNELNTITLENDLNDLKKKYVDAILNYLKNGMKQLVNDNEIVKEIEFSFFQNGMLSFKTSNFNFEIFLDMLISDTESIEVYIEDIEDDIILNTKESNKTFKEAQDLINNLSIEFPNIFEEYA